ncbi:pantoate--beta-alanine ligase [Pokkaliibacter sp. CJK22405]|uniref:pantoate--beta-alanine ligase n=1 Tax=Pokkaliibacter sp. CJK22405 TaxID=3384615 RepID=UPI0039854152
MLIFDKVADLRAHLRKARLCEQRIGFVPTMGNLHDGHISLIHKARETADVVVASIFVNPLQFGPTEDLERYPRTFEEDCAKLRESGCDVLFAPDVKEMYPEGSGSQTLVNVPELANIHCGASRPGHFQGVATVVAKLFGIVQPDTAIFGLKDFQQLAVIRQMVNDLCMPVTIIGAPIARADNGLALSSRNGYLTTEELATAPAISRILNETISLIQNGNRQYRQLENEAKAKLEAAGLKPDYFSICDQQKLQPASPESEIPLVILAAAYLGKARLIDNIRLD